MRSNHFKKGSVEEISDFVLPCGETLCMINLLELLNTLNSFLSPLLQGGLIVKREEKDMFTSFLPYFSLSRPLNLQFRVWVYLICFLSCRQHKRTAFVLGVSVLSVPLCATALIKTGVMVADLEP